MVILECAWGTFITGTVTVPAWQPLMETAFRRRRLRRLVSMPVLLLGRASLLWLAPLRQVELHVGAGDIFGRVPLRGALEARAAGVPGIAETVNRPSHVSSPFHT